MAYEPKEINRDQVVKYLNHAFAKAVQPFGSKNVQGTDLHGFQVEFAYLIDGIQRSPSYIVSKIITEANRLIESIDAQLNQR